MGKKHRIKQTDKYCKKNEQQLEKRQLLKIVDDIFSRCIGKISPKEEWEFFLNLYSSVEELRQKQKSSSQTNNDNTNRASSLPLFTKWLQTVGVTWRKIAICDFGPKEGFGIKALDDISANELLVSVPRSAMITYENIANNSYLDALISKNEILSQMPNMCLALYLHCEMSIPNSSFKPYLNVLPKDFNTTLYFSPDELKYLKGSPVLSKAVNHYKSIVRQFCLIYKIFNGTERQSPYVEKIDINAREKFTFDAYRWCVSAVSTRQNQIPKSGCSELINNENVTLAMIPLWDMFNHQPGPMGSVFDVSSDKLENFAMFDFKRDEQVTICYGARNNADLLIHNGFVVESNSCVNQINLSLGLSHQDALYELKNKLLMRLGCDGNVGFLPQLESKSDSVLVPPKLVGFLRVFHMDKEQLSSWLSRSDDELLVLVEAHLFSHLQCTNDHKICKYIVDRLNLLLMVRERSCGKDLKKLLEDDQLSARAKLAVSLQIEEQNFIRDCVEQCQQLIVSNAESVIRSRT